MRTLRASVIIPVYNGERTLERCLLALTCQSVPPSGYEVIVVDDGSTDRTAAIASQFPVRLIRQSHTGPAAARNRGIAVASGLILLFTDADAEPSYDWIQQMLLPFAEPQVAGAKGVYRTRQRELTARFVQVEYEEKYARIRGATKLDVVDTYSAAYRRDLVVTNGGFDESYPSASAEDAEFSFRLAKLGYRFVFAPRAVVYHQHARTLRAYMRRKFKIGYWRVRVHLRHPDKAFSDSYTPTTQKLQVILVPLLVATGTAAMLFSHVSAIVTLWGILAIIFVLSLLPLTVRAAHRDLLLGAAAPVFILCRATGQAAGIGTGIVCELLRLTPIGRVLVSWYHKSKATMSAG